MSIDFFFKSIDWSKMIRLIIFASFHTACLDNGLLIRILKIELRIEKCFDFILILLWLAATWSVASVQTADSNDKKPSTDFRKRERMLAVYYYRSVHQWQELIQIYYVLCMWSLRLPAMRNSSISTMESDLDIPWYYFLRHQGSWMDKKFISFETEDGIIGRWFPLCLSSK